MANPTDLHFCRAPELPTAGNGSFTYSCSKWSSVDRGHGGSRLEHRISVHGNSSDGHHLMETLSNGNTGQTRVIREVSRISIGR